VIRGKGSVMLENPIAGEPDSQPPSVLSAKAQVGPRLTAGHWTLTTDH
jgi:hypothetical protein